MDARTLDVLDFSAIRLRLAGLCATPCGRRLAEALEPSVAGRDVAVALAETDEARALLDSGSPPPVGALVDVGPFIGRARRSGVLDGRELVAVAVVAAACRLVRAFFVNRREVRRLADWAGRLPSFPEIERDVARCLDGEGSLRDTASVRLAALRRQQRSLEERVRERLESLLRSSAVQPYLQEPLVTLRGDRFVLPVRASERHQVPGVVHDQSASGATVFVEPLAIIELNNELRRLGVEERAESQRILADLSAAVGRAAAELELGIDILAHLDLALAKARLSAQMAARAPELLADPGLDLRGARHPLLAQPVPVDIKLGGESGCSALIVSGPNTGGKTVALKTAGLLACMAQAGLHLPAAEGSALGPFPQIFCDAGDDQGVAQNLSTFSSHLTHIARFLAALSPGALVLLDELGAGTDPAEGAALAIAILKHLLERGALAVATTHFGELVAYAYRDPRVENASVEFDAATLAPTYRLVTGLPGQSHALAIAERLGLGPAIVAQARALTDPAERHVGSLIAAMAADERRLAAARMAAEREREEAERLRLAAADEALRASALAAQALERARSEAEEILIAAKREADEAARTLRRVLAAADREALARVEEVRGSLKAAAEAVAEERPTVREAPRGGWRAGQCVRIRSLGQEGVLLAAPDTSGQTFVQVGALRVAAAVADLEPVLGSSAGGTARFGGADMAAGGAPTVRDDLALGPRVGPECDLRGLRVAEALELVDKYLDDAVLSAHARVRLVHGKGTGALRQAVAEFLRGHPQVERIVVGDGATEVELRGV